MLRPRPGYRPLKKELRNPEVVFEVFEFLEDALHLPKHPVHPVHPCFKWKMSLRSVTITIMIMIKIKIEALAHLPLCVL